MPMRNQMGPQGNGPMTGRGMGVCNPNAPQAVYGFGRGMNRGMGCRRMGFGRSAGFGRGYGYGTGFVNPEAPVETPKALLEQQRQMLEQQLKAIEERLNETSE